jgi:hypothetical protein
VKEIEAEQMFFICLLPEAKKISHFQIFAPGFADKLHLSYFSDVLVHL